MLSIKGLKPFLKYSLIGGAIFGGTVFTLQHASRNQIDSIGVVRLTRAIITSCRIGLIYQEELYSKNIDQNCLEYTVVKSNCHKKGAEKLYDLCCTNKGVYIKVGQLIAALDYIIPKEYVQTMKILHSRAPRNKIEEVFKVIKEDLNKDPSEIFETFEEEPLGTASLAQVHKATLKDGSVVAVKVQHPYVKDYAIVDMKIMEYLVQLMSFVFPEFNFQWLVDETKKNIPQELNFVQEGNNAERVAEMFKEFTWLIIPKVRWDYTTSRVLTMDFVEGGQINDLNYIQEQKIDPFDISEKLGELYAHMIFINGFVHSDPHPGNILIRKSKTGDTNIILLDHGLYADLKDEFRVEYANFWLSILDRDKKSMRFHAKNLGIKGDFNYGLFAAMVTGRPWYSIVKGIENQKPSAEERDFLQQHFTSVLSHMSDILYNVNRQMLLILKTNDLMRSIESTLRTSERMGAFRVVSKCCINCVFNRKYEESRNNIEKLQVTLTFYWKLLKINLFYAVLNFKQVLGV